MVFFAAGMGFRGCGQQCISLKHTIIMEEAGETTWDSGSEYSEDTIRAANTAYLAHEDAEHGADFVQAVTYAAQRREKYSMMQYAFWCLAMHGPESREGVQYMLQAACRHVEEAEEWVGEQLGPRFLQQFRDSMPRSALRAWLKGAAPDCKLVQDALRALGDAWRMAFLSETRLAWWAAVARAVPRGREAAARADAGAPPPLTLRKLC